MKARTLELFAAVAGYTIVAIVLTWPLALHATSQTMYFSADSMLNAYLIAWDQHAFFHQPWNIFSPHFFYPAREALGLSENLIAPALLTLPLAVFGNPILVYNAVLFGSFVASACAWRWTLRRWGIGAVAAWIGGLLFGFLPYKFSQLGHIQLLLDAWIPLALAGVDDWLRGRGRRGALLAAGALAGEFYSCVYLFYFLALFLVPFAVVGALAVQPPRERWRAMALQGACGAILALLAIAPGARPYRAVSLLLNSPNTLESLAPRGASFRDYLQPNQFNRIYGSLSTIKPNPYSDARWENELWMGWVAMALACSLPLALIAARKGRRSIALAPVVQRALMLGAGGGLLWLISLGPVFHWNDKPAFELPWYAWLFRHLPGFNALRVPSRAGILAGLALTGLAALAIDLWLRMMPRRAFRWMPSWTAAALIALAFADLMNLPLPIGDNPDYRRHAAVQAALAGEDAGVLLSLPILETAHATMLASTVDFRPVVNGSSGYMPSANARIVELFGEKEWGDEQLELLKWLHVRTLLLDSEMTQGPDANGVEAQLKIAGMLEDVREFASERIVALRLKPAVAPAPPAKPVFWVNRLWFDDRPGMVVFLGYNSPPWMLKDPQRPITIEVRGFDADGRRLWSRTVHGVLQQFLIPGLQAGWRLDFEKELWAPTQRVDVKFRLIGLDLKLEASYPKKGPL